MNNQVFNPFIKCRNPAVVHTAKGDFVQRCNKCDLCRQSKADNYAMQLEREEGSHKWSFFITLTYDTEWLPLYEVLDNYAHHDIIQRVRNLNPLKREKIAFSYDLPLRDVTLAPCFCRPRYKRGTDELNGIYDVTDDEYPMIHIKDDSFPLQLQQYNKHRKTYEKKYSKTNFHHTDGFIALAPKRDLEIFLLRLKNYAVRKCVGATFRYFAVPDYGTNGLAPHWHILLFTDSDRLAQAFLTKVVNYGTRRRPSPSAEFIHTLWMYGITNTSRVNKSCASYVAAYLNSPSNFPSLLRDTLQQRSYHSSHLGAILPKAEVYSRLKSKAFASFCDVPYYDNEGFKTSYKWQRHDYLAYLPSLPYASRDNLRNYESVVEYVLRFINLCKKDYEKCSLKSISYALYDTVDGHSPIFMQDYKRLQDYNQRKLESPDLTLFYTLVLNVSHIYKTMLEMEVDFPQYCDILASFEKWFALSSLREFYTNLQDNVQYVDIYYNLVEHNFNNQMEFKEFLPILNKAVDRIHDNVKHRSTAELYRFN